MPLSEYIIGFFVLFLMFSAVPCCVAVCRGERPERMFLVSLLANGLLLYLFAIAHLVNIGFYILLILNLLCYIPTGIRLYRQPGLIKQFFTPAVIIFWIGSFLLFLSVSSFYFIQWDEFSHWGFAPRLLFERESLNHLYDKILYHASYPPGLPLLQVLTHKCFVLSSFRESLIIGCNLFFFMICVLNILGDRERREDFFMELFRTAVYFAVPLYLMFVFFSTHTLSAYSDPILTVLIATAACRMFRAKQNWQDDAELMLLLTWIILFKKSGIPSVIFILFFYAVRLYLFRNERRTGLDKWMPVAVFAFPFVIQLSWSLLLQYCNTRIVFAAGNITLEKTAGLFLRGEPEYAGTVLSMMFRGFLLQDLQLLKLLLLLVLLYVLYMCFGKNRPSPVRALYIFIPLYFVLMMFFLYLTYLFIFEDYQALALVSYVRYTTTFLAVCILTLLFLFLTDRSHLKLPFPILNRGLPFLALCGMSILLFQEFRNHKTYFFDTIDFVRRRDLNNAVRKYDHILRSDEVRFTVFTTCGNGQKDFMFRYEYPDQYVSNIDTYNPKIRKEKQQPGDKSEVLTVAEVRSIIQSHTHILIDREDEDFFTDYSDIFEGKPVTGQFQVLYRVTPEGKLKYIPPRED